MNFNNNDHPKISYSICLFYVSVFSTMAATGLSFENPLFSRFVFYAAVVLLKTVFVGFWTGVYRVCRQVIYVFISMFLDVGIDQVLIGCNVCRHTV